MRPRTGIGTAADRFRQWMRRWLHANRPPRRRRQTHGALRLKSLEVRRVMYGADFLGLGEGEAGSVVADFSLTDVNRNSETFNQSVSPGDFQQQTSAWYFGHST